MLEVNEPFVRDLVEEMSLALPDSIMVEGDWVEFLWLTATPTAQPTDLPLSPHLPLCPLPRKHPHNGACHYSAYPLCPARCLRHR